MNKGFEWLELGEISYLPTNKQPLFVLTIYVQLWIVYL